MEKMKWENITSEQRIPKKKETFAGKYRSEMESDYHRIIRSASFRRLQDKTQVFPLDQSDFVRTRLTHSLEVSSIAKLIGKQICVRIKDEHLEKTEEMPDMLKVMETLSCAGLLHDIGNPPFGHFGETAIRNWFKNNLPVLTFKGKPLSQILDAQQQADLINFEGNAQALRIISRLHRLIGNNGMHLTSAVMDTIIKYPVSSLEKCEEDKKEKSQRSLLRKKVGYFQSESKIFHEIKENTSTKGCRNPLCFILEAADDLAYTFADLEDGYNKYLYTYDDLLACVKNAGDLTGAMILEKGKMEGKQLQDSHEPDFDLNAYAITTWLTKKQLYCISCVSEAFIQNYNAIMTGSFDKELLAQSSEGKLINALKAFAFQHIYNNPSNVKLELMGNEILAFFLDRFVDALIPYDSEEEISEIQMKYVDVLSKNYVYNYHLQAQCAETEEEKLYYRMLLATDYISGMTDSFAKRLYQELRGF